MDKNNFTSDLPRIAMISTHGYVAGEPPLGAADTGGQVVYVLELSKKLAQLGYEVDIWTRRFEEQPEIDVVNDRCRVIRVPCGGKEFIPKEYLYQHLSEWVANAQRFIFQHRLVYQFINSHYWDAGIAGMELAKILNVPHVHTPHSLGIWKQRQMQIDFPDDAQKFEKQYNFSVRNRYEKQIYRQAELVIATTPVQTDMLRVDYDVPVEEMRMIPPGYDDNRFFPVGEASRTAIQQRLGFQKKTVLALGRLAENKGYDLLIPAFKELIVREPEAHLHLALGGEKLGEKEEKILQHCRQLVEELGLSEAVTFSGYVSEEELPDYYRAADLFVLCSRYEPFGMTAVEAMACGTPTVATTHGGLYRVLKFGMDGLYADSFDAADLGITMMKPLKYRKLWDRLSRKGAQTARSFFTWTGIAQQLIASVEQRAASGLSVTEMESSSSWFGKDDKLE